MPGRSNRPDDFNQTPPPGFNPAPPPGFNPTPPPGNFGGNPNQQFSPQAGHAPQYAEPSAAPRKSGPNWGLILRFAIPAVVIGVGALFSIGNTDADNIAVGDCFEEPEDDFSNVKDQDCAGPHEAELYLYLPEEAKVSESAASDACLQGLNNLDVPEDYFPEDTGLVTVSDEDEVPEMCFLVSKSGSLEGSAVAIDKAASGSDGA